MAPSHSPAPAPGSGPDPRAADGSAESVAAFEALLTGAGRALLAGLGDIAPDEELAVLTRLRREHPAGLVAAAVGQARLRRRAVAKFGPDARRMYFTSEGLEQATRAPVADWRAARFAGLGARRVADLCCGVGGDALALARAGIAVLAVDRSPLTCAVARANAAELGLDHLIEVRCADVTETGVEDCDAVFIDPARRGGGSRRFDPAAYSPPLTWAVGTAGRVPHAAIKIGPGVDHAEVPPAAEAEWVSDAGAVKEAVLWFGTAAPGRFRATLLPGRHTLTGDGPPRATGAADRPPGADGPGSGPADGPGTGPVGRYLYEPDGAVIRAGLVTEVARRVHGRLLDPAIAYITADALTPTPYATAYEITETLPFGLKRLKSRLRERGITTLAIKKRGFAMTPEELRRRLRLPGGGPQDAVLFLTRIGTTPTMLLGRPAARPADRTDAPDGRAG